MQMAAHKSQKIIEHALKQYSEGKITIGRAAQMAGITLRKMIAIAAKKGIPIQYSIDDLKEDFQEAKSL